MLTKNSVSLMKTFAWVSPSRWRKSSFDCLASTSSSCFASRSQSDSSPSSSPKRPGRGETNHGMVSARVTAAVSTASSLRRRRSVGAAQPRRRRGRGKAASQSALAACFPIASISVEEPACAAGRAAAIARSRYRLCPRNQRCLRIGRAASEFKTRSGVIDAALGSGLAAVAATTCGGEDSVGTPPPPTPRKRRRASRVMNGLPPSVRRDRLEARLVAASLTLRRSRGYLGLHCPMSVNVPCPDGASLFFSVKLPLIPIRCFAFLPP